MDKIGAQPYLKLSGEKFAMEKNILWIATEKLIAIKKTDEQTTVIARIGIPQQISSNEWICPITLSGINSINRNVHGDSSMQALCLAASLIRSMFTCFTEDGGKLLYESGESEYDIEATFSNIGNRS